MDQGQSPRPSSAYRVVVGGRVGKRLGETKAARIMLFSGLMKPAVFIEREGILNDSGSIGRQQVSPVTLEQFRLRKEAVPLLQELRVAGLLLIVTTNQPGLSRGTLSRRELDRMHQALRAVFTVDDLLVCPHEDADRCPCRKPKAGLFKEAAYKWGIDLNRSFVISDKWQDAEAAHRAGATSMLVQSPWLGDGHHDFVLPDLPTLVEKLLQLSSPHTMATA